MPTRVLSLVLLLVLTCIAWADVPVRLHLVARGTALPPEVTIVGLLETPGAKGGAPHLRRLGIAPDATATPAATQDGNTLTLLLPPGPARVQCHVAWQDGATHHAQDCAPLAFTVGDKPLDLPYPCDPPPLHAVTQTVFSVTGQPTPHATVALCYAWQGELHYREAQTDTNGVVRWRDLPPAYATVWGADGRGGCLPPDAGVITTPLPPVVGLGDCCILPALTDAPYAKVRWWSSMPHYQQDDARLWSPTPRYHQNDEMLHTHGVSQLSLAVVAARPAMCWAYIQHFYCPYTLETCPYRLELPSQRGTTVHLRFRLPNGQALPAVSELLVHWKDATGEFPAVDLFAQEDDPQPDTFFTPSPETGGYRILLPSAGTYGLWVDGYLHQARTLDAAHKWPSVYFYSYPDTPEIRRDEAQQATLDSPPVCELQVREGETTETITLPEPLFTAPGGCTVNLLARNTPTVWRRTTVSTAAAPCPSLAHATICSASGGRRRPPNWDCGSSTTPYGWYRW